MGWYYIISHSFLPTQLFNFYKHENLRVFLVFCKNILKTPLFADFNLKKE